MLKIVRKREEGTNKFLVCGEDGNLLGEKCRICNFSNI